MNSDIIDSLLADWAKQKPDMAGTGMAASARIIHLGNRFEQNVNQVLKTHGIKYTDFDILATLRRKGSPFQLSPGELQKSVILTSGAMTACLKRLENKGLVKRTVSDGDRRGVKVTLTTKGNTLIEESIAGRFALADKSVCALDESELSTLITLLRKISLSSG